MYQDRIFPNRKPPIIEGLPDKDVEAMIDFTRSAFVIQYVPRMSVAEKSVGHRPVSGSLVNLDFRYFLGM
jgi:hypothetical protein